MCRISDSQDCPVGISTGYGRGSVSSKGKAFCSPPQSPDHRVAYPVGTGALSSRVKRPGLETDHSPSSAEVKNGGTVPPLYHTSSGRGA
jgi:hypothetical protein